MIAKYVMLFMTALLPAAVPAASVGPRDRLEGPGRLPVGGGAHGRRQLRVRHLLLLGPRGGHQLRLQGVALWGKYFCKNEKYFLFLLDMV